MKTTSERIEEIIEEYPEKSDNLGRQILKGMLEALVLQAKLEQLQEKI